MNDNYYEQVQESWPDERPSRKRARRRYRKTQRRRVVVKAERKQDIDAVRMSRALLAAQRELAQAQAEHDARRQEEEA